MKAILTLGGNVGDMKPRLRQAQQLINERIGAVLRCSHTYETKAWGFEGADFHNQALMVDTDLSPAELLSAVQQIERELGRDIAAEQQEKSATGQPYASRPMDIDIIFYGDEVVDDAVLQIPHPLLHEREFALTPLCEIAPDMVHPVFGKTIRELKEELAISQ